MRKRALGLGLAAVLAVVGVLLITAASRDDSDRSTSASASGSASASSSPAAAGEVAAGAVAAASTAPPVTGPGGVVIPADLVRVTLQLEPQRALGGVLQSGDKVAVAASFDAGGTAPSGGAGAGSQTAVLLEKVLVVNVQVPSSSDHSNSSDDKSDSKAAEGAATATTIPSGNLLVTLAVPAADAKKVVFASEYGRVWLAAESDAASPAGGAAVSRANVLPEPTP